jgi:translation initiation factor 1 (eIF-1/SUI1)
MDKFEKDLLPYHKIIDKKTKTEEIISGPFKGIEIITEKSHNKFITKVIGLEGFGFDLKLLRELKDYCKVKYACSI